MTPERCQEVVYQLLGTCASIESFLNDGEDAMDRDLTEAIDAEIFCCDECGWWCETCEADEGASAAASNDICQDCAS